MMSMMLYPCIVCISLFMYLFVLWVACLTVFVNCLVKQFAICLVKQFAICLVKQFAICLVKQFAICLGVVAVLLLNVMDVFSVCGGGGALLDKPCMVFQRMCVVCL